MHGAQHTTKVNCSLLLQIVEPIISFVALQAHGTCIQPKSKQYFKASNGRNLVMSNYLTNGYCTFMLLASLETIV